MTNAALLEQIESERRLAGIIAAMITFRIFEPRSEVDDELYDALRESVETLHALSEQIGSAESAMDRGQWL